MNGKLKNIDKLNFLFFMGSWSRLQTARKKLNNLLFWDNWLGCRLDEAKVPGSNESFKEGFNLKR